MQRCHSCLVQLREGWWKHLDRFAVTALVVAVLGPILVVESIAEGDGLGAQLMSFVAMSVFAVGYVCFFLRKHVLAK